MPSSVFTALYGSAHRRSSTGVTHSRAAASPSTGTSPVRSALEDTATSVFTTTSSGSDIESFSTGMWLLPMADSINVGVKGVLPKGSGRDRFLSGLSLPANIPVWGDEGERPALLTPAPARRVRSRSTATPSCLREPPPSRRWTPEGFWEARTRTIPSSACPKQNCTLLAPASP